MSITTPKPDVSQLGKYYESPEYISHSGKSSLIGPLYRLARQISLKYKRSLLSGISRKRSVLDYGCGTGEFIHNLNEHGWNAIGVEPSQQAREKALRLNPAKVFESIDIIPNNTFDVITLWHVLEHIPDPDKVIPRLKSALNKDGTLVIAVPNPESPDSQMFREHWAAYDVPRHLWHFSKTGMQMLLANYGLKIVAIKPMKFDAYYVSILSEKYRNQNKMTIKCILKGIFYGFTSNWKASRNNNYSSLIYVVKPA